MNELISERSSRSLSAKRLIVAALVGLLVGVISAGILFRNQSFNTPAFDVFMQASMPVWFCAQLLVVPVFGYFTTGNTAAYASVWVVYVLLWPALFSVVELLAQRVRPSRRGYVYVAAALIYAVVVLLLVGWVSTWD